MDFDVAHLPNSWQKRRIRDIGDIVTGRTPTELCSRQPGSEL